VGEGLSPVEVGKELGEHAKHAAAHVGDHGGTLLPISEAVVLSIVAIVAAWSGFSAAKWGTHSSLGLAKASATRSKANRAYQEALTIRVGDSTTFNAWFGAYISGKLHEAGIARKRFRPGYRVAFDAWMATHPFTNPHAPPGPAYMPQYRVPGQAASVKLDAAADDQYTEGEKAAEHADDYIRATVILASVLFLIGISSHFPLRGVRIGLISVGVALLVFAGIVIATLPPPP
jgi:hypothetical protein